MSDSERIVLASLIAPETSKAANKAIRAAKCDLDVILFTQEARDDLLALQLHGADVFGGSIRGIPIESLATPYIEPHLKILIAEYKQRLSESDRTLDSFETPGPDSEDPDCLFQNRWLRRGMCGAIVSTSGVGKSSFSMQAATLWAGGQECLGIRPLHPMRIGIFQSEDDEYDVANFRDRIRIGLAAELEWTPEQIEEAEKRVTFCALDGSTGARFIEHVKAKQMRYKFDLIIINPLFAFFGSDLNDGNAMTAFLRHGIDPLIKSERTKCGCLIVHHTGKPNKEALNNGEVFKAYLGSGSGEFTNYIRSAIVLTPWGGGKLPGVFDLIAAKHGDKLAWKDADGKPTNKKIVCYANRLPEYADKGMIYWIEPDEAQLATLKKSLAAQGQTKVAQPPPIDRCAMIIAELIRARWTEESRPADAVHGQKGWIFRLSAADFGLKKGQTGVSRATREAAWNLINADPDRFGLRRIGAGKGEYFISAAPTDTAQKTADLNPEQEDLF